METKQQEKAEYCAFVETCRYKRFCEGCPENCGKYTPDPDYKN